MYGIVNSGECLIEHTGVVFWQAHGISSKRVSHKRISGGHNSNGFQ